MTDLPEADDIEIVALKGDNHMHYRQDGLTWDHSQSYFRGDTTNFYPKDKSLGQSWFVREYIAKGLMPATPLFDKSTPIVAFGSCFAAHIADYLAARDYNVSTRKEDVAYISHMGDGIVNTYAIRQQFEWAWRNRRPNADIWHDRDLKALSLDEDVRLATKALFDQADLFIVTLGLSEIWYDEPTGEVFWRAVPARQYDPSRHKFRIATYEENLENLRAIVEMIHAERPQAHIVFSLSPVPLTATFRPMACMVADSESKAILRAALGALLRTKDDPLLHYMPSYEIVQRCFNFPYDFDRTHVHEHIVDFAMNVFERYYCGAMTDEELFERFRQTRIIDMQVGKKGHKYAAKIKAAARG